MKEKLKEYKVFISQVNQRVITVKAKDKDEAGEKGYRKWKRGVDSQVRSVEEVNGMHSNINM